MLNDNPLPVRPGDEDKSFKESHISSFLPFSCFGGEKEEIIFSLQLINSWTDTGTGTPFLVLWQAKPEAPLLLFQWKYTNILLRRQQNPSAQIIELPLAKPSTGSRPAGIDHTPRKEQQGVALPTGLKAP